MTQEELIEYLAYKTWYDLASQKGCTLSVNWTATRTRLPKPRFPKTAELLKKTPIQCRELYIPDSELTEICKEWDPLKRWGHLTHNIVKLDLVVTIDGETYRAFLSLKPIIPIS